MDKDAILAYAILCLMGASCSWLGKNIGNKGQKKSTNSATDGLSCFISTMKWALPTSPIWTCQGPGSHSSPRATSPCPSEAVAGSGCNATLHSPALPGHGPCPAGPMPGPTGLASAWSQPHGGAPCPRLQLSQCLRCPGSGGALGYPGRPWCPWQPRSMVPWQKAVQDFLGHHAQIWNLCHGQRYTSPSKEERWRLY